MIVEQYYILYIALINECKEGPYSLDEVLKRRNEMVKKRFKDWKIELEQER